MGTHDRWFLLFLSILVAAILVGRNLFPGDPAPKRVPEEGRTPLPGPASAVALTIHYHERAPYYVTTAEGVRGLCVDPLRPALAEAHVEARWVKTPPKRQLKLVEANSGADCILGWFKTPEREAFGKFSVPLYRDKPTIALARAGDLRVPSRCRIDELLARRDLVLLRKDGYSYGAFLDEQIARHTPTTEVAATDNVGMLRMLGEGRADYFFIAEEEADVLLDGAPGATAAFRHVRFDDMVEGNRRYLVCSRQVDGHVLATIDAELEAHLTPEPR